MIFRTSPLIGYVYPFPGKDSYFCAEGCVFFETSSTPNPTKALWFGCNKLPAHAAHDQHIYQQRKKNSFLLQEMSFEDDMLAGIQPLWVATTQEGSQYPSSGHISCWTNLCQEAASNTLAAAWTWKGAKQYHGLNFQIYTCRWITEKITMCVCVYIYIHICIYVFSFFWIINQLRKLRHKSRRQIHWKQRQHSKRLGFWWPLISHHQRNRSQSSVICTFCRARQYPKTTKNRTWAMKKNSYFPLYWLLNRDPYNGLL